MSLTAKDSSGTAYTITLRDWSVIGKNRQGTLVDNNGESFFIEYPLPLVQEKEDFSSCKIFLFKNRFGTKEDHCFNLEIDAKRKGVIFPIKIYSESNILPPTGSSKETDFFYRFLHIGYYHLLNCANNLNRSNEVFGLTDSRVLKIEDFYDDETVVLLYHGKAEEVRKFDIKPFYPQLIKLGYVPIVKELDFYDIENLMIPINETPLYSYSLYDTVKFRTIANELTKERYISQLFESTLKYSLPPLSKFILLYQVIELLIDKIALEYFKDKKPFSTELSVLMIKADKATSFRDVFDSVKKINDRINSSTEIKNEETRINKLFNEKCKLDISQYVALESNSKKILSKPCVTLTDYIYALRNKIVHDFHNLSSLHTNIDDLLYNLNIEFEKLIFDVIIKYSNNHS